MKYILFHSNIYKHAHFFTESFIKCFLCFVIENSSTMKMYPRISSNTFILFHNETLSSKFRCYLRSATLFEWKSKLPVEQPPYKHSYPGMIWNFKDAIGENITADCVSCEIPAIPRDHAHPASFNINGIELVLQKHAFRKRQ